MSSIAETNKVLYDALKKLLPGIPQDNVRKFTLRLESGTAPVIEIEKWQLEAEGGVETATDLISDAYCLVPLGKDSSIDVTCLTDLDRKYAPRRTGPLSVKVDAKGAVETLSDAAEILKRYGAGSERSEIAALTEEVRQLRTEISALLYEVAKNTKRSADIADFSFAAPAMVDQIKVTPVGGGPSAPCSGQEGPRTGHFIDGHGIKHTNLGGQG